MKVQPDYVCAYGPSEAITYYYLWKCIDQKRVVVSQWGYMFWTAPARKYESFCDRKTEIEESRNLDLERQQCEGDMHWKTN